MSKTLESFCESVRNGTYTAKSIAQEYLTKIQSDTTNSFVRTHESYVEEHSEIFSDRDLCGAAIGVKDIFMTQGYETSCGSKMLEGYIPPYTATCIQNLEKAGGLMIGKTNMDEFAMGTTGETSYFGPTTNPYDQTRVAGGSSSGSAAAVAGDLCIAALGTDTGGSIRLPAALCGIVGIKGTYGRVSRYGVQAMASSFDHVGVFSKTVKDGVRVMKAMAGQDCHDATTTLESNNTADWLSVLGKSDLSGKKLAVIKQFMGEGIDEDNRAVVEKTIALARSLGAEVEYIDLPIVEFCIPTYYVLVPAEVSTNLAKFDGIKHGLQKSTTVFDTVYDYYSAIRKEGFGDEVKRRILTGSYVLSAGYYDAYFKKALLTRKKIQNEVAAIFETYDALIGPMTTGPAWELGALDNDPIAMYLMDIYAVLGNLTQAPAMSIPCGYVERGGKNLPVGFQIMTKQRNESEMFSIASVLESALAFAPLYPHS